MGLGGQVFMRPNSQDAVADFRPYFDKAPVCGHGPSLGRAITNAMLARFASSELEWAFETVTDADGVIAVTPAFNASLSGLFKSFFDVLPEETLSEVPVLIAATGGTERHSLVLEHALRPMFSYLHAIVSPTGVYAATDDFGAQQGSVGLAERIGKAADYFARLLPVRGLPVHGCSRRRLGGKGWPTDQPIIIPWFFWPLAAGCAPCWLGTQALKSVQCQARWSIYYRRASRLHIRARPGATSHAGCTPG